VRTNSVHCWFGAGCLDPEDCQLAGYCLFDYARKSTPAAVAMSNAKIASMIAEANERLVAEVSKTLAPVVTDLAQLVRVIDQVQSAIAPMAAEIERLRADVDRLQQGAGLPPA